MKMSLKHIPRTLDRRVWKAPPYWLHHAPGLSTQSPAYLSLDRAVAQKHSPDTVIARRAVGAQLWAAAPGPHHLRVSATTLCAQWLRGPAFPSLRQWVFVQVFMLPVPMVCTTILRTIRASQLSRDTLSQRIPIWASPRTSDEHAHLRSPSRLRSQA